MPTPSARLADQRHQPAARSMARRATAAWPALEIAAIANMATVVTTADGSSRRGRADGVRAGTRGAPAPTAPNTCGIATVAPVFPISSATPLIAALRPFILAPPSPVAPRGAPRGNEVRWLGNGAWGGVLTRCDILHATLDMTVYPGAPATPLLLHSAIRRASGAGGAPWRRSAGAITATAGCCAVLGALPRWVLCLAVLRSTTCAGSSTASSPGAPFGSSTTSPTLEPCSSRWGYSLFSPIVGRAPTGATPPRTSTSRASSVADRAAVAAMAGTSTMAAAAA